MVSTDGRRPSNIIANNFGGLNRTSSPLNLPINDSPFALNVDFDISGKVKKRLGTRTFWTEVSSDRTSISEIQTNLGYSFITSKLGTSLRVFHVNNDKAEPVWSATNVFRVGTHDVTFVKIPGSVVRVLALNVNHTPIQLRVIEQQILTTSIGVTVDVKEDFQDLGISIVFKNREQLDVLYAGGPTLTIPGGYGIADTIDIITFSWQWLAESYYYFGDNFHRSVTRAGASLNDQNVQIPQTINSNIVNEELPNEYGIFAFINNAYDNQYLYRPDGKPGSAYEYSFGDGATYQQGIDNSVTPSPFFVTFGREARSIKLNVSNINVNPANNTVVIKEHGLETRDFVEFYNEFGLYPPLVAGVPYVVQKLDNNTFKLFTDETFTTEIDFQTPVTLNFTDADIDTQLNRLVIPHPFPVGSVTQVVFQNLELELPVGLAPEQEYYAFALTSGILEIYFDKFATRRVDLLSRPQRLIFDTGVAPTPQNIITITNHLLFPQDGVRIFPYSGSTVIGGVTPGQLYYVDVLDPNSIQLFTDKALTNLVTITSSGSGQSTLYRDGGVMQIRQEFGDVTLEKINFSKVDFVRLRPLMFNGGDDSPGIAGADLHVTVNGELVLQNTTNIPFAAPFSYQLFTESDYTIVPDSVTLAKRIGFTGSTEIGLPQNAVVRITNKVPRWVGSASNSTEYSDTNRVNGAWEPIFGISKYCNYRTGEFFNVGTFFQSRLVLGGLKTVPQQILFSSKSSLRLNDSFYFFQISEDNVTPDIDPFDVIIPEQSNYTVQFIVEWQRALYIFTDNSVFRTTSQDGQLAISNRVVGKVSEKGAVNPRCVTITESTILFVSDTGVYDLSPVLENEYRAAEVSIKIREYFGFTTVEKYKQLPWIAFDDIKLRVFVGLPREVDNSESSVLLVYDTVQGSWTEYAAFYKFRSSFGISYTDKLLGKQFMIAHRLPCFMAFTRFNFSKYLDFVQVEEDGTIGAVPIFVTEPTYAGITEYFPDITMLFLRNVVDVRVFVGSDVDNLVELEHKTQWKKSNNNSIILVNDPGDGILLVTPNVPESFFGALLLIDNIKEVLNDESFGSVNFGNPCICSATQSGYSDDEVIPVPCEFNLQPNAKAIVGYPYHAVYVSPVFTADLLSRFKKVRHLHVMFDNVRERYRAEDVNLLTQVYSDLVNRSENDLNVSLALIFQTDLKAEKSVDVYNRPNVEKFDSWSVFKEPLKGVGYSYQFVCWSLDEKTWIMNGYQIVGRLSGERFISGDR